MTEEEVQVQDPSSKEPTIEPSISVDASGGNDEYNDADYQQLEKQTEVYGKLDAQPSDLENDEDEAELDASTNDGEDISSLDNTDDLALRGDDFELDSSVNSETSDSYREYASDKETKSEDGEFGDESSAPELKFEEEEAQEVQEPQEDEEFLEVISEEEDQVTLSSKSKATKKKATKKKVLCVDTT